MLLKAGDRKKNGSNVYSGSKLGRFVSAKKPRGVCGGGWGAVAELALNVGGQCYSAEHGRHEAEEPPPTSTAAT